MDVSELGGFIRLRREALQPEDIGLPRGPRRRADGLRREEVADLAGMSADYYARLERGAGPQPSEQMLAAIARALRLSLLERDHLFRLAGHPAPHRRTRADHISPGLMRVLDRLVDTPAQIMNGLGETLAQTPPARALLGDETAHVGPARSAVYRWFTEPASRAIYRAEDHELHARTSVAQLRKTVTMQGPGSPAALLASKLEDTSDEFRRLWAEHEVGLVYTTAKHFVHPDVGELELHCQVLIDPDQDQSLLVFTATPGSEHAERLDLLRVLGTQRMQARTE